jgi:hypothetical protein
MAGTHSFSFDRVFGPLVSQVDIFSEVAKPVVEGILKPHNFFRCPQRFQRDCILLRLDRVGQDIHYGGKRLKPLTILRV